MRHEDRIARVRGATPFSPGQEGALRCIRRAGLQRRRTGIQIVIAGHCEIEKTGAKEQQATDRDAPEPMPGGAMNGRGTPGRQWDGAGFEKFSGALERLPRVAAVVGFARLRIAQLLPGPVDLGCEHRFPVFAAPVRMQPALQEDVVLTDLLAVRVGGKAERLEHHISDEMEARIEATLGFPTHDPHGEPIPSAEGIVQPLSGATLDQLPIGVPCRIERAVDRDPERLRYLGELGLYPGALVTLIELMPFDGPLRIQVGAFEHIIGRSLAGAIYATPND